jgi:hypothetical protein
MNIYLYIKTHNVTGLQYFGKTVRDPFKYKGSGKKWCHHLAVHGEDISTDIYGVYSNLEDCSRDALEFSHLYNIVESDDWANLIPENGHNQNPNTRYCKATRLAYWADQKARAKLGRVRSSAAYHLQLRK